MSKDTSMAEIWKDWCRLCGHHDIHSGKSISLKNNSEITQKILKYLSLQDLLDEDLPENICLECDEKVSQFDLFALRCEKIQTTFIEMLSLQHSKCDTEADIANKSTAFDPDVTKKTPNEADDLKVIDAAAADDNGKSIREDGNLSESNNDLTIKNEISDQSEDTFSDRDLPFDNDPEFKMRKKLLRSNIKSVLKEIIETDGTKSFILDSKKTMKKKVKSSFLKYDCHVCHEDCRNWHALCIHFRDVHNARAKVMCVCGKFLASRVSIGRHCAKHGKVDSFTCPSCSKRFPRASELEAHQVSHLPIEQRPFVCCKCARRFTSNQLLRHHERMHIPINQRLLHPCDVCNTKFATKSGLAMHIRAVHERLRPFVCDQCGRTFTTKGILEEHQVRHSDARPHQCDTCNKSFKTKQRLAIHADTHGNTVYQCPHCPVKLNSRRTLRMHLFVHDEICRYRCSFCEKAFKRAKDLKNHHNLHTGRRPYICPWCARSFANGSNCRAHKRRMHPVELAAQEAASLSASNVPELSELKPALADMPKVIHTTVKRKTPLKPITQPKLSEIEITEKEERRNTLNLKNLMRESIKEELISPSEQNEHATQKMLGYQNSELSIIPIVESAKENEDEMSDEAMHVPIIVTSFGKGGQACPYLRNSGNESLFMANSFFGKE